MAVTDVWCHVTVFEPDGNPLGRWTLRGNEVPGLAALDRIARLHLAAKAFGGIAMVTDVVPRVRELLELAGLGGLCGGEPGGQSEGREDSVDVEEGMESGDPSR